MIWPYIIRVYWQNCLDLRLVSHLENVDCEQTLIAVREFRIMPIYHVPRGKIAPICQNCHLEFLMCGVGL